MTPKKKPEYTVGEYARLYVQAAPSVDTMVRRRNGLRAVVEDFGGRALDGGITDPEARTWAVRHPGNVRYAKQLFNAAVEDGVAAKDPFRRCRQPTARRKIKPPSVDQVRAAAEAALELPKYGREMRALVYAAAGTGLRVSELCALEVRDVIEVPDLRLQVWDGKGHVDRQSLVLEPFGGSVVEDALRGQMPEVGRVWMRPPGDGYRRTSPFLIRHDVETIWAGKKGKPGLRDRVGLSECRWHDLRHFHATWLLDEGHTAEDVAVQLLGHADPELIISTYGHPSLERARQRLRRSAGERA